MSTVFELIRDGKLPAKFLWDDDVCFAILDVNPVAVGHALVIPKQPIDKWTDLPPETLNHVMDVAAKIGRAQEAAFDVPRSAVVIAGFAVPHAHVHVIPAASEGVTNLGLGSSASSEDLEDAHSKLTEKLTELS